LSLLYTLFMTCSWPFKNTYSPTPVSFTYQIAAIGTETILSTRQSYARVVPEHNLSPTPLGSA
jgi:hypothetical protein